MLLHGTDTDKSVKRILCVKRLAQRQKDAAEIRVTHPEQIPVCTSILFSICNALIQYIVGGGIKGGTKAH